MAKKSALADLLQKTTETPKKEVFTGQVTAERQVRLNINIPEPLLRRIRITAAERGTSMTKLLIPLLEREFSE